jgi:hypothetical protein
VTTAWYVRPALEARRKGFLAGLCAASALALAACGGEERQDEDEPEGRFRVDIVDATFPVKQKLAKRSELSITVRNAGERTVPNIAVTVNGLYRRRDNPDLADPNRPVFVINGRRVDIGGVPEAKEDVLPEGCDTSYVSTWACGPLKAGAEKTFKWSVTAVEAGPYKLAYRVSAGLDGKAKAVAARGSSLTGRFTGRISDAAPDTRVADDGHTIVKGTR